MDREQEMLKFEERLDEMKVHIRELESERDEREIYIRSLEQQLCDLKETPSKEYKIVRTYDRGNSAASNLKDAFEEGWEFLRASDYVPEHKTNTTIYHGYIEYILCRDKKGGD